MHDSYISKEVEDKLRKLWTDEGIYKFDSESKKQVYSIDTPPPTISGLIHMGHVFSYSQADFVARYKRMRGFNVFYPFGFDNNGLPTELLVEKNNNITAEKVGREKFIELVEKETKKYEDIYKDVWTHVGISVDWSLLYSTISKEAQITSQRSFLELSKLNRVYRKETPTIWCPKCKTAVSQMELKDKMVKSKFVDIRFKDDVIIATTRPELLPAVVAIFVNPNDEKNRKHVGKLVRVPIFGQEVKVFADSRVDPKKGTGIVMCSTFGDLTDIEWYKAYDLDLKIEMDDKGRMLNEYFKGMSVKEAREKITEDLKEKGYVLGDKSIEHSVNSHERCGTEVEFLVKKQWFVKYLDMKKDLIDLGNKLKWHPEYMHVRYDNWINGLQWDWSISRQRYYGIPFPVWYCKKCDEPVLAKESELPVNPMETMPKKKCAKCGSAEFAPEYDIMDTWMTSSLTPLINTRFWLDNPRKNVYPMSLRPQAHDIISFWLFTTVVKCYLHTGKVPWSDVLISGHGLDKHGKPMHKSLGNVVEPLPVIEKYGADALRHWASLSRLGEDASFQEKDVISGAKLVNKLWNVAKFVSKNSSENIKKSNNVVDRWMLSKTMELIKNVTMEFESYNSAGAKRLIDEFFWSFCDNYLEFIKYRIYGNGDKPDYILSHVFFAILKMMAPFLPYVTDEIYLELYAKDEGKKSIHVTDWPKYEENLIDGNSLETGDKILRIISYIRQWKHARKMALNAEIQKLEIEGDLEDGMEDIAGAMKIKNVLKGIGEEEVPGTGIRIRIVA
ncbi:MAG: valine--tRNA ligase [Candidatus Marsarchaeota archaeon]|nr:valine--tRNA ligase [Candidatus Marsarchaeota archaeon]